MNRQRYKVVFNRRRGEMMAVAENATANRGAAGSSEHGGPAPIALSTLRFSLLAVVLAMSMTTAAHAQIYVDRTAPRNQQPTVLSTGNGVPLVNIQTPNGAGVSLNVFRQFDVAPNGVILNNARGPTPTQLGGHVQGNPWLATGTARVIVNQVNSTHPSYLRGYVEVAGDRAQVVIANPAGITCAGCGFINANRATLTTGKPVISGLGLEAYRVAGGTVTVDGAGFDAREADYADIISRAVKVNAGIWARKLKVTAGLNTVNADNSSATPGVAATDAAPAIAIDVARLGGMYAGHIFLTSNEHGVGVRNTGMIGAGPGEVVVTADGRLENRGVIDAGNTVIASKTVDNIGTGRIYGDKVAISAEVLNNQSDTVDGETVAPVIAARNEMNIGAGVINNSEQALIHSGGDMALAGALDASGKATGTAAEINNSSATINADGNLAMAASVINNTNAHLETRNEVLPGQRKVFYRLNGSSRLIDGNDAQLVDGGSGRIVSALNWRDMGDEDNFRLVLPGGGSALEWTIYDGIEQITRTVVTKSAPGMITSGGDMTLAGGALNNYASQIIAGGTVVGDTAINNTGPLGVQSVTSTGSATYTYVKRHQWKADDRRYDDAAYQSQTIVTNFQLGIASTDGAMRRPPVNALYHTNPTPGTRYLIETDPQFTSYRDWLSSDFMLKQLQSNPDSLLKKLGDGFYEQQLVQQQIQRAIGQRYLAGYSSNEAQFMALMNAGAQQAQAFNYAVGVALTKDQIAQLTSDVVWMVKQTVTLNDGSTQQVLAPQVYLRGANVEVTAQGTLIAGNKVALQSTQDIVNDGGTIAAREDVSLLADNIQNLGGRISASNTALTARTDLNNLGGAIEGSNSVSLLAGRDISSNSTTTETANAVTTGTNINQVASVRGNNVKLEAGRDLVANASVIAATSEASLSAGNDVKLGTVIQKMRQEVNWATDHGASNWVSKMTGFNFLDQANGAYGTAEAGVNRATLSKSEEIASRITGNKVAISAGQDLVAKGTQVVAEQAVTATAGRDVALTTANESASARDQHQHSSNGFLSGTTIMTDDASSVSRETGSTLSGNTTLLTAGRNANITGSDLVSTQGTTVTAGNDINAIAATETSSESHYRKETTSGILTGGGLGVTVGQKMQSSDFTRHATTASASTIGATDGNVAVVAADRYRQIASNVLAPGADLSIIAKQIDILAGVNTEQNIQVTRFKQQGVTIQVTNPVISAIQAAMSLQESRRKTKSGRSKILADAATALTLANAAAQVSGSAAPAGGIDLAISMGSSSNQSRTEQNGTTTAASAVASGGTTTIAAVGAGAASNINIVGSEVTGKDIALIAENQINLVAQRNTNEEHSTNKASSASAGVSIGTSGLMFNVSASGSRGKGDGSDSDHSNTQVIASDRLNLRTGGDATLKGATASGQQVIGDIGGNLNIESLQDTSFYKSQQQSLGGSVSAGVGKVSGSISASRSKVNGNYQSVTEQSGILAGDDGFQLKVGGNTDLKGGKIASTDKAVEEDKNKVATAGLTMSDIRNESDYEAESQSFSAGGGYGGGKTSMNGTGLGFANESGSESTVTTSGISGIAGDASVRSDKDSSSALVRTWNAKELQADVEAQAKIMEVFGKQASKAVGDYAQRQLDESIKLKVQADETTDPALAQQLKNDAAQIENDWGASGVLRLLAHTAVGGLTGGVDGALGAAAGTLTAPLVADALQNAGIESGLSKILTALASTTAGATVGGGAGTAAALNEVANNFLGHADQQRRDLLREKAKTSKGLSVEEAKQLVYLEISDQIGDSLLQKYRSGVSLTSYEKKNLEIYLGGYAQLNGRDATTQLVQNGSKPTYSYPYAGASSDRSAYARNNFSLVARLLGHKKSPGEEIFNDARAQAGIYPNVTPYESLTPVSLQTARAFSVIDAIANSALAGGTYLGATALGASSDTRDGLTLAAGQLAQIGASFILPRSGISPIFGQTSSNVEVGKNRSQNSAAGIAVNDAGKDAALQNSAARSNGQNPKEKQVRTIVSQQQKPFDEVVNLFDKTTANNSVRIDGNNIQALVMGTPGGSNLSGSTKVFDSQTLTDQQIFGYAQRLAGNAELVKKASNVWLADLGGGQTLTLRSVSSSQETTGARWTIDLRGSTQLRAVNSAIKQFELKFR